MTDTGASFATGAAKGTLKYLYTRFSPSANLRRTDEYIRTGTADVESCINALPEAIAVNLTEDAMR